MANIRVDALTEVTTIADDDVVMVDGKQGVRATTWETLKNLIKQQCGINELNTNLSKRTVDTIGSCYTQTGGSTVDLYVKNGIDYYDELLFLNKYGEVWYNSFVTPTSIMQLMTDTTHCINMMFVAPANAACLIYKSSNNNLKVFFNTAYTPLYVYGIKFK